MTSCKSLSFNFNWTFSKHHVYLAVTPVSFQNKQLILYSTKSAKLSCTMWAFVELLKGGFDIQNC